MRLKHKDVLVLNILAYVIVGLFALLCVLPFIMVVSGSFSSEKAILQQGYSLLPREATINAYSFILRRPAQLINAYKISLFVTLVSVSVSLFLISMTAYVLYRKDFRYRNIFAFVFYFTTLFNGGMLPMYILMVRYLGLKNSIFALMLPGILNIFYLLVMRNFMNSSIPDSLIEAAKIDGAGDFYIFLKIVMPLMKPALASIGLFISLNYWNDWYNAMLYIQRPTLYPLQYMLYQMLMASQSSSIAGELGVGRESIPQETFKLAMTVVATGPIVLAYPMVQKYFVKGITIGAVKG